MAGRSGSWRYRPFYIKRLICAAQGYLQQTGQSEEPVRFDVAEVVPLDSGRWMVHIIKGAFTA